MMVLFRTPADPAAFEARWSEEFLPLVEQLPGLRRVSVGRVTGGPEGLSDLYLVHEFYFDDASALRRALASPEGQAAGRALMGFAADLATVGFVDHHEENR